MTKLGWDLAVETRWVSEEEKDSISSGSRVRAEGGVKHLQFGDAHAGLVDVADLLPQGSSLDVIAPADVCQGWLPAVPLPEEPDKEVAPVDLVDASSNLSNGGEFSWAVVVSEVR